MSHKLLLIAVSLLSLETSAHPHESDTIPTFGNDYIIERLAEIEPTYLEGVTSLGGWQDNWFVNVSGGASAFIGSPLGCNDLFGRIKPLMQISVGKWHTPAIGTRLSFQGFDLKDSQKSNIGYRAYHADFLWNLMSGLNAGNNNPKWSVTPYVGLGLIHNNVTKNNPFAFTYGISGSYRLTHRLHLTMELGGITTFKDFDGRGDSREFGDNLLNISAGLSFAIGKTGWRKVVDAAPYIRQNEWLIDYNRFLTEKERTLRAKYNMSLVTIAELRKVLEIENLLDKYGNRFSDLDTDIHSSGAYPKNDYSGLNSLKKRLKENRVGGKNNHTSSRKTGRSKTDIETDVVAVNLPDDCIGSPIHFFFILGTTRFTDPSQIVNVEEIAGVCDKYGLSVRVAGSADEATGNKTINDTLGLERAKYIADLLTERGIPNEKIAVQSKGGINEYDPVESNRQVCVTLYHSNNEN